MRLRAQLPSTGDASSEPIVAVLIPCFNEAPAIAKVISDFKAALPDARIYVYDNNSTDDTRHIALQSGALVRSETMQGKGFVVRRMFADVEADIYVMVDGDDTYDAAAAPSLISRLVRDELDMVNAARVADAEAAFRAGHRFGNWMLTLLVRRLFGDRIQDLLSGYRVFSRRYAKSFPALSGGFEIETELTVHALQLEMPIAEMETDYKERASGSVSKLRTYRDGFRIVGTIFNLLRDERPLSFFGCFAAFLAFASIALAVPIFQTFARTGLVPRFPTAILSTGLMLLAFLSFTCGLVLDALARTRKQLKRLSYLSMNRISRRSE